MAALAQAPVAPSSGASAPSAPGTVRLGAPAAGAARPTAADLDLVRAATPATRAARQDDGVRRVRLDLAQEPAGPNALPAPGNAPGQAKPLEDTPAPGADVVKPDVDPGQTPPDVTSNRIQPRPGGPLPAEEAAQVEAATAGFASILQPGALSFDEAAAAGLAPDVRPYVINPAQALTIALLNSRAYQYRIEQVYIASLAVTLNRFNFTPQGFAGLTPSTLVPSFSTGGVAGPSPGGGSPTFVNPQNSFLYRTREYPGGPSSTLSLGTAAGFGKLFMFGGRLAGSFANQTIFNFVGTNPRQPTVQSFLPLSYVQPFLSGGGRAITLESLTQAERLLVYEVRNFTRYRQQFVPYILAANNIPNVTPDNPAGFGGDPNIGYLQVIQQLQVVENDRRNVAAFEQILKIYAELAKGPASGLSQLQVDQVEQSLQSARQTLVGDETSYRNLMDQYKYQLGMPPDTPVVLDRSITAGFRNVFNELDEWSAKPVRDPEELIPIIAKLPRLNDADIDGHSVMAVLNKQEQITVAERAIAVREQEIRDFQAEPDRPAPTDSPAVLARRREIAQRRQQIVALKEQLARLPEDLNLAAERTALESRVDLMNQRGQLYDSWRQLTVTANGLLGIFNVGVTNQFATPATTTNPFAFIDQAKQFSLVFNAELPIVRVAQRNTFRSAEINYRRQQRVLQQYEDTVKYDVRLELRNMLQYAQFYEIGKRNLFLNLRQKDNIIRQILAPPTSSDISNPAGAGANQATQTINLINAQTRILGSLNQLIQNWVQYETQRLTLYTDMGIIPYDEWEAYYELFPSVTADAGRSPGTPNAGTRPGAGPAGPGSAPAAGAAGRPPAGPGA